MADTIVQTPKGPRRVTEKVRAAARANAIKARAAFLKKHKAGKITWKKRKGVKAMDLANIKASDIKPLRTVEIPLDAIPAAQPATKKKYAKRAAPAPTTQSYAEFVAAAWQALNNLKGN